MSELFDKACRKVGAFIATDAFFGVVIAITALQALWYIFSMQPNILDEGQHIGFINAYSHRLSPFITSQPQSLDFLGDTTHSVTYLYYYLMSWPLRLFAIFTHSVMVQDILLRFISLLLFIAGLVVYRKALLTVGSSKSVAHVVLLFLVLTPSVAPLPGAVNYDNAAFLLSGLLLWRAAIVIRDKKVSFTGLSLILVLGMLGTLIQFELLALFIPLFLYVVYELWVKHKTRLLALLAASFRRSSLTVKVALSLLLIVSAVLFIERPVLNVIQYHALSPECTHFLSQERCLKNYTAKRDIEFLAARPASFQPVGVFVYMLTLWIPGMIGTNVSLLPWGSTHVMQLLFYTFAIGGAGIILVYLRDTMRHPTYRLLIVSMVGYAAILAAYLYSSYERLGQPVAISSRYLLLVAPIFMYFTAQGLVRLFGRHRNALLVSGVALLLLFTQGGGVLTSILVVPSNVLWQRHIVVQGNSDLKALLKRVTV